MAFVSTITIGFDFRFKHVEWTRMKLLYCGYNGFNQMNDTQLGNAVIEPTVIFEKESDDSDVEVYLGWSCLIIIAGQLYENIMY